MMGFRHGINGACTLGGGMFMMLGLLLIIAIVFFYFSRRHHHKMIAFGAPQHPEPIHALEIAKTRLANGEITIEEYENIKKTII